MRILLSLIACLITSVLAVFPDEAYQIDYHYALLGFPQQQTTFFHQPYPNSKASLIYTLSDRGVIGAVNPKDGSLIWRQFFASASTGRGGFLKAGQGQNTVVSAASDIITAWSASEGRLVWESRTRSGKIKDLEILESNTDGVKDVIAVIEHGQTYVKRLDGKTGKTLWTYADER
jgi:outer membrane protein assembly factor BamB